MSVVGARLGVSRAQIMASDRHRHLVLARSLTVYLARQLTPMSYPEIAAGLGKASHSAIVAADQRIAAQLKLNPAILLPLPAGAGAQGDSAAAPDWAPRSPNHAPSGAGCEELALAQLLDHLRHAIARTV